MNFLIITTMITIIALKNCLCSLTCRVSDRFCNCDSKCLLYGDCCQGHPSFNRTGEWNNILTCREFSIFERISIVNRCADKSHKLADLCGKITFLPGNRLKSLIPVISDEGDIYDNVFCAKCNGKQQFHYLNTTIKCFGKNVSTFHEVNDLINSRHFCSLTTTFPTTARFCSDHVTRNCPPGYNNKVVVDNCEKIITDKFEDVTDRKNLYRNMHCCTCWNQTCFNRSGPVNKPYLGGFSYLLNFNEWDNEPAQSGHTTNCSVNGTVTSMVDNIVYYSSFVLTLVSVLSLVILIIIYSFHSIFHNFGGYLTICVSSCLLLMHILTLALSNKMSSTSRFCQLLAIVQHFIALSNFLWMAIYALDLLQTFGFSSTANRSKKKSFNTFLGYTLIGFGISATVVGAATIVEFKLSANNTIAPKYGGEHCWFMSKIGGIIWYFVPVCFLLTWNFVACVIVFYKLSKTARECRVVQQKESSNTLWLCVRLTAVFGIGYLLQITAVLSAVNVLIVAGSLLNCLQGCLFSACFVWTKRVRTVVSSSFSSVLGSKSGNSNTTSQKQNTQTTRLSKDANNFQSVKPKG